MQWTVIDAVMIVAVVAGEEDVPDLSHRPWDKRSRSTRPRPWSPSYASAKTATFLGSAMEC